MQINEDTSIPRIVELPALTHPKRQFLRESNELLVGNTAPIAFDESMKSPFFELDLGTLSIGLQSFPPDFQPKGIPYTVPHDQRMGVSPDPVDRHNIILDQDRFEDYPFYTAVIGSDTWHENDHSEEVAVTLLGSDTSNLMLEGVYPWYGPWFMSP